MKILFTSMLLFVVILTSINVLLRSSASIRESVLASMVMFFFILIGFFSGLKYR